MLLRLFKNIFCTFIFVSTSNILFAQVDKKKLVWAEEFNYKGLPNKKNWNYDVGTNCPQNCGWGNNELEYYTAEKLENVKVENGVLKITALKKTVENSNYTSARLLSKNKVAFKYGKIECRAKLPTTKGTWPAFWMLGANYDKVGWPACGEIDIMEHKGNDLNKIFTTLHYNEHFGSNGNGDTLRIDNANKFHIYTLDWSEKAITFYVDNKQIHTVANNSSLPFNQEFYFIVNLAIGGNFAGEVDENLTKETMEVDYIRVYK